MPVARNEMINIAVARQHTGARITIAWCLILLRIERQSSGIVTAISKGGDNFISPKSSSCHGPYISPIT